jgi:hypothetical protein
MGEITLYTNLNIDREKDFSIENLVKSDNTQAFFDFDKNEILDSENADIYFFVDCGTDCFNSIFSINNAKSARIGEKEPKLQGCLEALQEKNNIITSPIPGNYSCIKTNSGNIVQILPLRNEAKYRNAKLVFQYTIWYQGQ